MSTTSLPLRGGNARPPGYGVVCSMNFLRRMFHQPYSGRRCFGILSEITKDKYERRMCVFCNAKNELVVDVQPPRGTRDFPPEMMRLQNWLFTQFHEVSRLFGFEQVDFPVVETEALYVRKSGEEITEQLYSFEDKSGRRLALRPELTPSLARLIIQKGYDTLCRYKNSHLGDLTAWSKSLVTPTRWYTIGQCWRYERMTRGRRREHYQWNMDIFGVSGVEAEAELLSAVVAFFEKLGLSKEDIWIRVSNRKIVQAILDRYSVPEEKFPAVCVILDKLSKLPKEEIEKQLLDLGLNATAINGIMHAILVKEFDDLEELLGSKHEAVMELKRLFELADGYGFGEWLLVDLTIMRGLSYYTGIVFEAFDSKLLFRAICGGGRYDKLISTFGGPPIPACGFGFGDAVIMELLESANLMPELSHGVDDVVFVLDEELRTKGCEIASKLRSAGRSVDLVVAGKKLKWVFKHAERLEAKRLILLGRKEYEEGNVRVKDLETGLETDVKLEDVTFVDEPHVSIPKPVEKKEFQRRRIERNLIRLNQEEVQVVDLSGKYPEEYEMGFPSRRVLEQFVEDCKLNHKTYRNENYNDDPAPGCLKYLLRALEVDVVDLDNLSLREGRKIWAARSSGVKFEDAFVLVKRYEFPISQVLKLEEFDAQRRLAALRSDQERL